MPRKAKKTVQIPQTSIPTYIFGSPADYLPDEPIIMDPERPEDLSLSLKSYRSWSQRFAAGLCNAGVCVGDRVLFMAANSVAWPVVFMGTLMSGAIFCGVSPELPVIDLHRMAQMLEPSIIVTVEKSLSKAIEVGKNIGLGASSVFVFESETISKRFVSSIAEDLKAPHHWQELLHANESFDWTTFASSPDQIAAINYTSGSTGFSKGVKISHGNMIANSCQFIEHNRDDAVPSSDGTLPSTIWWAPMYHAAGQNYVNIIRPKCQWRSYIMPALDIEKLLEYTQRYRPELWLALPPLLVTLLSHPSMKKYDISSVRHVRIGGAPVRQSLAQRFENRMPHRQARVSQGWGMTELTCFGSSRSPLDRSTTQSCGELLPNVEAKVMSPDGLTELVEPYQSGELWIKCPNLTKGYWKDPERTEAAYRSDGWLQTGDFGHFDEHERLYVKDRIQDIIFLADPEGAYILPTDLEMALLDTTGVLDAGVTSVQSVSGTKVPRAFVVLDPSSSTNLREVEDDFNLRVEEYQRLTGGLFSIDIIPKSPAGKVNRVALRQIAVTSTEPSETAV